MSIFRRSYVAAAFNARPFGMFVPPNWLGLAAFGLLGGFVNPGFWLIGAGLEALYLWGLSRNARFRAVVDATSGKPSSDWHSAYSGLIERLDEAGVNAQRAMEHEAAELMEVLTQQGAIPSQLADVRQMVWLHLKLLAARDALLEVCAAAERDRTSLDHQEKQLEARLAREDLEYDLRRSLEQQLSVIHSRRAAHADAQKRCELVDAELERLRQQIALVREQALLATDEGSVGRSVDALSASLNEANRWLKDQRELFAGMQDLTDEPPPAELLRPKPQDTRSHRTGAIRQRERE